MNILPKLFTKRYSHKKSRRNFITIICILSVLSFFTALFVGSSDVSVFSAISDLFLKKHESPDFRIIFYVRLPRVLGAAAAGAALAVAGVIIQAVLNNPMAAPNVIGVNAGAGFFAIICMALFPSLIALLPLAAFLGAFLTALLIYFISALTGAGRVKITLVGVAVGSIMTAGINTVKVLFPDSVYDVSGFLIGGLSAVAYKNVLPAIALIIPALVVAVVYSGKLDALSLGEEVATGLGVFVKRERFVMLVIAAVLAGAAVSFSGLVGFVGLIVPHILRRIIGANHKYLIPASIFAGALFLILTDMISRVIFKPYEIPVGILLSLIGGPFFISLIMFNKHSKEIGND